MRIFLSLSLIFFMVSACTPQSTPTPIATLVHPTETLTPTQTPATPTEAITPTSTPDSHLTVNCLDVLPDIPQNAQLSGTLALGTFYGRTNKSYLLNLQTGEKTPLLGRDDEILRSFSISPDSHWLAYTSVRTKETWTDRLVIIGADGKPVKDRLVSEKEWIYMDGWLDNQNLVFEKYDSVNWSPYGGPLATVIYNPFTTQQKQLASNYPDIMDSGLRINGWPYTETVYDPALLFVTYPRNDWTIVLWDRGNNKEIVDFPKSSSGDYGTIPVWSPNGNSMLKLDTPNNGEVHQVELFDVSKNGDLTQLTFLSQSRADTWPTFFSWSPDMQHIAFWLYDHKSDAYHLSVLNMETKLVTNYCLEGLKGTKKIGGLLSAPQWSPDSQKLLINIPIGLDNSKAVVIDITQGYAAVVAEDMMAMGWLTNEP